MVNEFTVNISGLGDYIVNASIQRVLNSKTNLECEIEVIGVKKFNHILEAYDEHDPSENELDLIEREIAIKFFNSLH